MKTLLRFFNRSLPARILLVFVLTSVLISTLLLLMVSHGFSGQWRNNIRPHLTQYLDYVNEDIGNPPDIARAKELSETLPIDIYITGPDINFSSTGSPLDISNLTFDKLDKSKSRSRKNRNQLGEIQIGSHRDKTVLRNEIGDYRIYYELPHRGNRQHRDNIIRNIVLGIAALLAICFLIFRHMLKPVQDIKTGVRRMGDGELSYRVPVRKDNDLGELTHSINTMADDIEKMLDAKRQLLLGVSHELRSPLTRANIALNLMDDSPHRVQLQADLNEMEKLIGEIMEAERINTRHAVIHRESIELVAIARAIVEELAANEIELVTMEKTLNVNLDEARVKILLRNLLSNAVKYGLDGAEKPQLILEPVKGGVVITVRDFGPGIDAEHLERITEPFYRIDPSRTRSTGGFGIGLYLCKLICEAHQGELAIESVEGTGTTVIARLSG